MPDWLVRLREAGENATPRPWYKVVNDLIGGWSASTVNQPASEGTVPTPADFLTAEDAAFIALARNVWPLVVDALEAAEENHYEEHPRHRERPPKFCGVCKSFAVLRAAVEEGK